MRILVYGPRKYPFQRGIRQVFEILPLLHEEALKAGDKEFVIISGLSHEYDDQTHKTVAVGPDAWAAQWAGAHRKIGVGLWAKSIPEVDGWGPANEPNWKISNVGGWGGSKPDGTKFKRNEAAFHRNLALLVEGRPTHAIAFIHRAVKMDGTKLMYDILDAQKKYAPHLPRISRTRITPETDTSRPITWD